MPPEVLSPRALNRATLERQWLRTRRAASAEAALDHLVGLQAQSPTAPYFGLWSRLEDFRAAELSGLLWERRAVRLVLLRGTVHLVRAEDAVSLRALVQPVMDRDLRNNARHARYLVGLDLAEVSGAAAAFLSDGPVRPKDLRDALSSRFPGRDPASLAYAARGRLPLVQAPPRGVWGEAGEPRLVTAASWLADRPGRACSLADLLRRYLAAFGPASVRDAQTWSGLSGLRAAMDALRPELRTFRDENGTELFDLPDAPRPDPDGPAEVRLVAPYDNLLLSHADRSRVMSGAARRLVLGAANGVMPGAVLLDGFVEGAWTLNLSGRTALLRLTLLVPPAASARSALEAEAERLLEWAAPDAGTREFELKVG